MMTGCEDFPISNIDAVHNTRMLTSLNKQSKSQRACVQNCLYSRTSLARDALKQIYRKW